MLRKLIIKGVMLVSALALLTPLYFHTPKASAVSPSQWNAARIIDDSVFFNPNTMSADAIQQFLTSKVPNCTGSNPTCLKGYSQAIPTINADAYCSTINGSNGAQYNAATIIKLVTAACNMNPQAMIVLLQKEQGLVTSTAPSNNMYTLATGYGCPDSQNVCDSQYYGFFNQVYHAARVFQYYVKNPNDVNYAAGRTSNILWNPNTGCGSSPVTIQNAATAGLYNYTPYQPNQAALNAGYGTGDSCSAYGNRNFWLYFWDWFGSPIGSEYAWLIDSFTYSSGDNVLTKGYTETLTLKARNVGRQPWYNSGDHPIRLGTYEPENRTSAIFPTRPATLQEAVVQPNQVGTFQWQVNPQLLGTFAESLNLVAENYTWFSWPGFRPTTVVTDNPYQWQVNSVSYGNGTGVMDPGSQQDFTVWVTNTGNTTWTKNNPPIWLATWGPDRASAVRNAVGGKWPSATRITQFNETSVAPGAQASFQFSVYMPYGGNFYERLNLVAEGQNWFNDPGLTLYLHGRPYAWQPVWSSLSTGNPNIGRNQTFDVTFKAKNTGEMAWYNSGNFPVRVGTSNPMNRGSGLYYTNWLSDTRPAKLIEPVVPPGSEGTFTFTARTPSTPGARNEYFNLVAEGVTWFTDPSFYVYVNVL